MPKDETNSELQKHTLHLFAGDYDELGSFFPTTTPAKVIRHLVRDTLKRLKGSRPDVDISFDE